MIQMTQLPISPSLQWTLSRDGSFITCGRTQHALAAGAYRVYIDHCGEIHFKPHPLHTDDLIEFPESVSTRVLGEIERFWSMGDRFAKLGFAHRRGYLFYGKQGCGKSSLIHQIVSRIVDAGHIAFLCTVPQYFRAAISRFREVEPDRPVVCVFEDIDAMIKHYGDSELLQILDGNAQVNKVVNLASTNYPERLDRRIIARPRRFDRLLEITSPEAPLREAYFARKLPELSRTKLARWVKLSAGLPFAALTELVISVECLGHELEAAAATLRELDRHTPSSNQFGGQGEPLPETASPDPDYHHRAEEY
jgi:SpoVK/Ycf46/Vps4 family AAA+-type ATPase